MNEKARKQARWAELEYALFEDCQKYKQEINPCTSFEDWLTMQSEEPICWRHRQAKELIALYEE